MNYNELYDDEKKKLHDSVSEKMKKRLVDECTREYVNTKSLTKTGLDVLITDYLEAFWISY